MSENTYNNNIIVLRFIAILIVVFGHSIIIYDPEWEFYSTNIHSNILVTIKHIINLIQMPLFFSISGYLFFYSLSKYKNRFKIIYKNFRRLIIPFIIVGLFYFLPMKYILNIEPFVSNSVSYNVFHNVILGFNNGHLWYLTTLFIIFIIICFVYFNKRSKILDIIYLLVFAILNLIAIKYTLHLYNIFSYLVYFYIGCLINKYNLQSNKPILFIIFPITLLILLNKIAVINLYMRIFKLIITILIIIFLYNINFSKLSNNKIIKLISNDSFGLYLFHSPLIYISFINFPNIHPLIMILFNFFFLGLVALLITELIKRSKLKFIIGL